jgi:adenylate cyclase
MMWHVDEFAGANAGLVLAEIELRHAGQTVLLPDWIGEEVTLDQRYRNSRLTDAPWGKGWGRQPRKAALLGRSGTGAPPLPCRSWRMLFNP